MSLALNIVKMAKESFASAATEETRYFINKSHAKVREEKNRGVEFPGHRKVKAAIQSHTAMLRQKPQVRLPSWPKWHRIESIDTLERQRNGCTSSRPRQSADSRADSQSARQATCPTRPNR